MYAQRKVKVYISAHDIHQARAFALDVREAGHEVVSQWHDETPVENFAETLDGFGKTKRADDNFADIDKADVLIQITGTEKVPGGEFVELGYALGRGKKVFLYNHGSTPKPENLASNGSGIGKLYTVRDSALVHALDSHGC